MRYEGGPQFVLVKVVQMQEHGHGDRAWTAPVWFEAGGGGPAATAIVRITSLLPDPAGDDRQNESATLRNTGTAPAQLAGWKLRDAAGQAWSLDSLGTLAPGESKTILRAGQPMALNNGGDTVQLLDKDGNVVQTVTYTSSAEGQVVSVG